MKSTQMKHSFLVMGLLLMAPLAVVAEERQPVLDFLYNAKAETPDSTVKKEEESGFFSGMMDSVIGKGGKVGSVAEVVILHTPNGFVPSQIFVKRGMRLKLHVVNVNSERKHLTFVMDGFSIQRGTPYAEVVEEMIDLDRPAREPASEGSVQRYTFYCPITGKKGELIVTK